MSVSSNEKVPAVKLHSHISVRLIILYVAILIFSWSFMFATYQNPWSRQIKQDHSFSCIQNLGWKVLTWGECSSTVFCDRFGICSIENGWFAGMFGPLTEYVQIFTIVCCPHFVTQSQLPFVQWDIIMFINGHVWVWIVDECVFIIFTIQSFSVKRHWDRVNGVQSKVLLFS